MRRYDFRPRRPRNTALPRSPLRGEAPGTPPSRNSDLQRLELHGEQAVQGHGRVPGLRPSRPRAPGGGRHRALDEEILRTLRKDLFGGAYAEQEHAILVQGRLLPRDESARGEVIVFLDTLRFDHFHRE